MYNKLLFSKNYHYNNIFVDIKNYDGEDISYIREWIEKDPESVNRCYHHNGDISLDMKGTTPLQLAISEGFCDVAEMLLQNNAKSPVPLLCTAISGFLSHNYSPAYMTIILIIIKYKGGKDPCENAEALADLLSSNGEVEDNQTSVIAKLQLKLAIIYKLLELPIKWDHTSGASLMQLALFNCYLLVPIFLEKGAEIQQILIGPMINIYKEKGLPISSEIQKYVDLATQTSGVNSFNHPVKNNEVLTNNFNF